MTIVETSVWVDLFRQTVNAQTEWVSQNRDDPSLGLTDLTLCEILQGLRSDTLHAATRKELLKFNIHTLGGVELTLASADNYRFLRKHGLTVRSTVDCLIATYCIRGSHQLLHRDRDFDAFEEYLGLKVIHP